MKNNGAEKIENQALQVVSRSQEIQIFDQGSYNQAVILRNEITGFIDGAKIFFEPMKQKAWESHKEIVAKINQVVKPAEDALKKVNQQLAQWIDQQAELERARQAELQESARLEAERDRAKELKKLSKRGYDQASLDLIASEAIIVQPIEVEPTYDPGGVSARKKWSGEVVDLLALIKFVAKNKQFLYLLEANQTEVNKLARSMRENMDIPGVKIVKETVIASKR
jgi:hypothetical protein